MAGNRFKVHDLLPPDELAALEDFTRDLRHTVDDCHTWMLAKGYTISRSAVGEWKRKFVSEDRYRAGATLASELMRVKANEEGAIAVADAGNTKLHQMIFDKLIRLEEAGEDVPTKDLLGLAMSLRAGAATKKDVEELKKAQATAIAEANRVAKEGGTGEQVAQAFMKVLGV